MGSMVGRNAWAESLLPRRQRWRRLGLLVLMLALSIGCGRLLGGCAGAEAPDGAGERAPATAEAASEERSVDAAAPAGGVSSASSEDNQKLTLDDIPADVLISVEELQQMRESDEPPFIVDIRAQGWWIDGHIPEARNIPAGKQFDIRMDEIPKDREVVVIVPRREERVAEVWQTLVDNGYDPALLKALAGGMDAWKDAGMDIQEEEDLGC